MKWTTDERASGSVPSTIKTGFEFSSAEIDAFAAIPGNYQTFSLIFGPKWEALPDSEKLEQYMELQMWIESQAVNLNLAGGEVVPKEK